MPLSCIKTYTTLRYVRFAFASPRFMMSNDAQRESHLWWYFWQL